jgi:hypothetical protein
MLVPWKSPNWPTRSASRSYGSWRTAKGGLYAAHMVLRQVDWSLRHQDETAVWWPTGMGEALLDVLDA